MANTKPLWMDEVDPVCRKVDKSFVAPSYWLGGYDCWVPNGTRGVVDETEEDLSEEECTEFLIHPTPREEWLRKYTMLARTPYGWRNIYIGESK
jgi:hypothetical protein